MRRPIQILVLVLILAGFAMLIMSNLRIKIPTPFAPTLPAEAQAELDKQLIIYFQLQNAPVPPYTLVQAQQGVPVKPLLGAPWDETWCVIISFSDNTPLTPYQRQSLGKWLLDRRGLLWDAGWNVDTNTFRQFSCTIG